MSDSAEAGARDARRPVEMVLYVSPGSPASVRAQQNIQALIARFEADRVELDIRDVAENPERAEEDRILFIPTLVVRRPVLVWIVGDLTNGDEVMKMLQSYEIEEEPQ